MRYEVRGGKMTCEVLGKKNEVGGMRYEVRDGER